ncbi:MAG: chromosome segregation protein SMC [Candidatus Dormibacteria bacterium]
MHLRNIRLSGFKTFAHPADIALAPGITAIVGPNGSGKSNVVDAIRWVLGETNARDLRGKRMEDVIFHGSKGRSKAGFAEVSLVLDNSSGVLPLDFAEVQVTRRIERGGDSEYLINGSRARLRDVERLLAATGLGTEGYALVAQDDIDFIIGANPRQRRALLEQAAGVLGLRTRRDEALRRLDLARGNLVRIDDLGRELRPRVAELARQAAAAAEAVELSGEIARLQGSLLRDEWRQARVRVEKGQARRRAAQERVERQSELLAGAAAVLTAAQSDLDGAHEARLAWERRSAETQLASERARHALELARQRAETLDQVARAAQSRLAELEAAIGADRARLEALAQELDDRRGLLESARERTAVLEAPLAQLQEMEQAHREAAASRDELQRRADRLRTELEGARAREDAHRAAAERALSARAAAQAELAETDALAARLEEEATLAERARALAAQQAEEGRAAVEAARAEVAGLDRALAELRTEVHGDEVRLESVSELERSLATPDGQLLETAFDVPAGLELAVQAGLEHLAGAILAGNRSEALDLAGAPAGRVRVVWPVAASAPPPPAGFRRLAEVVKPGRASRAALDALMGSVWLAPDAAAALALEVPAGVVVVTESGDVFSQGMVAAGAFAPTRLTLAGDRRRLEAAIVSGRAGVAAAEAELLAGRTRVQEAAEAAGSARSAAESTAQFAVEAGLRARQAAWESERVRRTVESEGAAAERELAAVAELEQSLAGVEGRLAELGPQLAEAGQGTDEVLARLEAARVEVRSRSAELENARSERALAAARMESLEGERARLEEESKARRRLLEEYREQGATAAQRAREAVDEVAAAQAAPAPAPDLEEANEADALRLGVEAALAAARAAEDAHVAASVAVATAESAEEQAALELQAAEAELAASEERLRADEVETGDVALDLPVDWRRIQREIGRRQRRLGELGPVNPLAPADYDRTRERLDRMDSHAGDVRQAEDNLRRLAGRLGDVVQARFDAVLGAVGWHFQETFQELFAGGTAGLRLVQDDDGETGVEVIAQPPNKRLQSLSLLSGGEKAMTCLSFILALEQVNPSPFYVFDEVDAALDDTSVARFTALLRRLAGDRQFLLVTHNHHTMAQAGVLYGVTSADGGISRILSVRLEDQHPVETGARTA